MIINVDLGAVKDCASQLAAAYSQMNGIRSRLTELNLQLKRSWNDDAMVDFTARYNQGMDYMLDMLIAIDGMESFLNEAADFYKETDEKFNEL